MKTPYKTITVGDKEMVMVPRQLLYELCDLAMLVGDGGTSCLEDAELIQRAREYAENKGDRI